MAENKREGFAGTAGNGNKGDENVNFTRTEIIIMLQQLEGIRRKLKHKLNTV